MIKKEDAEKYIGQLVDISVWSGTRFGRRLIRVTETTAHFTHTSRLKSFLSGKEIEETTREECELAHIAIGPASGEEKYF